MKSTLNRIENVLDMYGFKIRVDLPEKRGCLRLYAEGLKKKIAGKIKNLFCRQKSARLCRRLMFQRTKYLLHSIILQNRRLYMLWLIIAMLIIIADQAVKYLVVSGMNVGDTAFFDTEFI